MFWNIIQLLLSNIDNNIVDLADLRPMKILQENTDCIEFQKSIINEHSLAIETWEMFCKYLNHK